MPAAVTAALPHVSWNLGGRRLARLALALRAFFALLFKGTLPDRMLAALGLARRKQPVHAATAPPAARAADGAVQMLALLQRDGRLVDFLIEDISAFSDSQVGATLRGLHDECRRTLLQHVRLDPVIDGIEGTFTRADLDPSALRLVGNVQPGAKPSGGILRHRGWRASKVDLPSLASKQDASIVAPAEIEIE